MHQLGAVGGDDLEPGVVQSEAVGHVQIAQEDLLAERRRLDRRLGRQADTVDARAPCKGRNMSMRDKIDICFVHFIDPLCCILTYFAEGKADETGN